MEFKVSAKCRKCGGVYTTYKRYNDFIGKWELDSDSCDECEYRLRKRVEQVSPMVNMN